LKLRDLLRGEAFTGSEERDDIHLGEAPGYEEARSTNTDRE
jgi:hypothetical protein